MNTLMRVAILIILAAHFIVLGFVYFRSHRRAWLLIMATGSLLASVTYLPPSDFFSSGNFGRGFWLIGLLMSALVAYGSYVVQDIPNREQQRTTLRAWLGFEGLWLAVWIITAASSEQFLAGQPDWLLNFLKNNDVSSWLAVIGMLTTSIILLGIIFFAFHKAFLPETANRSLFWLLNTIPLSLGALLAGSSTELLAFLGMIALLTGMIGTIYADRSYRVFEIRSAMILFLRTSAFVGIVSAIIFAALYLASSTNVNADKEGLLVMAAAALLLAALYVPARYITEIFIRQLTRRSVPDPAQATREYSQVVSEVVDLNTLIGKATATLNRVMRVKQSSMILLNSTFKVKDAVELVEMRLDGAAGLSGYLSVNSPIYHTLAAKRKPISQFDIEFAPEYQNAPQNERDFFHQLQMSAYAPIVLENVMIGILACGPKLNDTAFYARDLELLGVLAQQTAIAVRNARLFDDLQHLNTNMRSLNRTLKATNEQLERMDSVKTDFVTIASHELRTPLAQIRGYTDIIEALNEQGLLDPDQTQTLVTNLRKATERMEELISAMLDVSQLDVDAMDLRFNPTSIESVIKMAIEPLTDPMRMRKISLSVRGTRGLPTIQADLQRLVQAFRNIIVNAIKFTPDSGRIEITAALEHTPEGDHILVNISDTGVGIEKKNLEMIFKKFFRAYDPSLHSTGTYKFLGAGPGLGLTIARGVIEGHGGKIWAESPGHDLEKYPGATFHIMLPISTPESARRVLRFEGHTAAQAIARPEEVAVTTQENRSI